MNRELESLIEEATIYARNYSSLRRGHPKWEAASFEVGIVIESFKIAPRKLVKIVRDTQGRSGLLIQKRKGLVVHLYQQDFLERIEIKRNPDLVKLVYALWVTIDPNHLKVLPAKVYKKFCRTIVEAYYRDPNEAHVSKDLRIDLKKFEGIVFSCFYDSIFAFVDQLVRSKHLDEYLQIIRDIQQYIFNSSWYPLLNFDYKNFVDSRPCYHAWMLPHLLYYTNNA